MEFFIRSFKAPSVTRSTGRPRLSSRYCFRLTNSNRPGVVAYVTVRPLGALAHRAKEKERLDLVPFPEDVFARLQDVADLCDCVCHDGFPLGACAGLSSLRRSLLGRYRPGGEDRALQGRKIFRPYARQVVPGDRWSGRPRGRRCGSGVVVVRSPQRANARWTRMVRTADPECSC